MLTIPAVVKIPKSAILSTRTSSLPPLPTTIDNVATTSHTVLGLTLALLHEMRLGTESKFWGYVQSLPRTTVPIPALWPLAPAEGGNDALRALDWLKGTEAARDIRRRQLEGVGLVSLMIAPFECSVFRIRMVGPLPRLWGSSRTRATGRHTSASTSPRRLGPIVLG